jgi:hypothetical protein
VKISPKSVRLVASSVRSQDNHPSSVWTRAKKTTFAVVLLTAALSSAAYPKEKSAPPTNRPAQEVKETLSSADGCGHPIVKDSLGNPYKDPVCIALSDKVQPPLYIPDPECDRGGVSYDSKCFFQRLLTVMTASPGPAPLNQPE